MLPAVTAAAAEARLAQVTLGDDYRTQVFYDLEGGRVAGESEVASWDLQLESPGSGDRVFINGGKDIAVCRTGSTVWNEVLSLPPNWVDKNWHYDAPSGDSTAIGPWRDHVTGLSRGEIYLLRTGPGVLRKVRFISVSPTEYRLEIGSAKSLVPEDTLVIQKDPAQGAVYATISTGGTQVYPAPPAATWDLLFTRYRHIYYDLEGTPYVVTGVLLPPGGSLSVAKDSLTAWEAVTAQTAAGAAFSTARDAVGFDWKRITSLSSSGRYEVNQNMIYLIRTRNGKLYKLRFLDFYAATGEKGSPTFEAMELR